MRLVAVFALSACSFQGPGSVGEGATDGSRPDAAPSTIDAAPPPDSTPDARPPNVCAGYAAIAGAGDSTFRSPNMIGTYANAKQDCENDVPGVTRLAIPQSLAESDALWRAVIAPGQSSPYYRVGITWVDGAWVGDDGSTPPLFFAMGQPNGDDSTIIAGRDGEYYDFRDDALQEYVCECPP